MAHETLTLKEWHADRRAGRLVRGGESRNVEPKVMDLLFLLADEPGRVYGREEIAASLWPGTTVNEDSLARCIFKLRRALDDDRRDPRFVETIPKRGYRLIAADAEAEALLRRADEFYFQFTLADNEAAIALYEHALTRDADNAVALAGLAGGLTQRAIRWLGTPPRTTLKQALDSGAPDTPEGADALARARALAERAVFLRPRDAAALKALGLTLAARRRFPEARAAYEKALKLDPANWGVLINLADLDGIEGDAVRSLSRLEEAFYAMSRSYASQAVMIRPWHAALAALIAERYSERFDITSAKDWYRCALALSPLYEKATAGLAKLLVESGEADEARALCRGLVARIGESALCAEYL